MFSMEAFVAMAILSFFYFAHFRQHMRRKHRDINLLIYFNTEMIEIKIFWTCWFLISSVLPRFLNWSSSKKFSTPRDKNQFHFASCSLRRVGASCHGVEQFNTTSEITLEDWVQVIPKAQGGYWIFQHQETHQEVQNRLLLFHYYTPPCVKERVHLVYWGCIKSQGYFWIVVPDHSEWLCWRLWPWLPIQKILGWCCPCFKVSLKQ